MTYYTSAYIISVLKPNTNFILAKCFYISYHCPTINGRILELAGTCISLLNEARRPQDLIVDPTPAHAPLLREKCMKELVEMKAIRTRFFLLTGATLLLLVVVLVICNNTGAEDQINSLEKGHYETRGPAFGVDVSGGYAYITDEMYGLTIINVSDPENPMEVGHCHALSWAQGVAVRDGYAYVANHNSGLVVIDVSDPTSPMMVGYLYTNGSAWDVTVSGDHAYIADGDEGLVIIDVSDPTNPMDVRHYYTDRYLVLGVAVSESYLYVANGENGLVIINISDPTHPTEGHYDTADYARSVAVSGGYAYITDPSRGLVVIDVSDPEDPKGAGHYDTAGRSCRVAVSGGYAYVADWTNGLVVVNLNDYDWDGVGNNDDEFPYDSDEWKDTDGDGVGDNSDDFKTIPFLQYYWQFLAIVSIVIVAFSIITSGRKFNEKHLESTTTELISTMTLKFEQLKTDDIPYDDTQKNVAIYEYEMKNYAKARDAANDSIETMDKLLSQYQSATEILKTLTEKKKQLEELRLSFNNSLFNEFVNEFQKKNYGKAINFAETGINLIDKKIDDFNEIKAALHEMKTKLQKASKFINVAQPYEDYNNSLKAFEERNLESAKLALDKCNSSYKEIRENVTPILSISIPEPVSLAGQWQRVKTNIKNEGTAHAFDVNIQMLTIGEIKINHINEIRSGEELELEVGILINASGNVPVEFIITCVSGQNRTQYSNTSEIWLNVGGGVSQISESSTKKTTVQQSTNLKVLCETENYRGFIRAKIAVFNNTGAVITDSKLRLLFDTNVLRFDHIEPAYITHGEEIELGNINRQEKKTIAVYLDPMMCTTTNLDATFTYRDVKGNIQMEKMRKKGVIVLCPIFFTEDTANPAMLKNLVANVLKQQDSKIFNIPMGLKPQEAFEIAKSAVSGRSVNFVREFSTSMPFVAEAWYYAVTKGTKMQMVIKVAVLEKTNSIEIFAAAQSEESLTGLLAELGHDLKSKMKQKGMSAAQITNITIKDSIIQRSSLLFGEEHGTENDINISDSIINRSHVGEEREEKTSKVDQAISSQSVQESKEFKYDIAISYASEDREIVEQYAHLLKENNVKVFYDSFEKSDMWGKDLHEGLDDIYRRQAAFCVIFISKRYTEKSWTVRERISALGRAFEEDREYLLPVKLDGTDIPGVLPSVVFVDLRETSIEELVRMTIRKLQKFAK